MIQSLVSLEPYTFMVQSEIINGPDYDQTETINFCYPHGFRETQFRETKSYIGNRQLCRLHAEPAIESLSTFYLCER